MSATALILRDAGVAVSGSDEAVYPPMSTLLSREGLSWQPYDPVNIPLDADLIVIGKNAKLVPETNAEVAAAYASGIPTRSFPEVLAELSHELGKTPVVVAGSYGKSTSTALLAHCLIELGADPSYVIGAVPLTPARSAHLGQGDLLILEGDEYPSSNTDPRSKFLHLDPAHLLLTPVTHDHVNVFPTPASYLAPFRELLSMIPEAGTIVACTEGDLSAEILAGCGRTIVTYGLAEGDYRAADIAWGETTTFAIMRGGKRLGTFSTTLLGAHNIQNIVGVAAFLLEQRLGDERAIGNAIASFRGLVRRLDRKSEKTRIPIFEGFGSSYEKARSAIDAMRQHFPEKRLLVVFEPHTFSWRNRDAIGWYDDVFAGAAKAFIYEPATQGAQTHQQLAQEEIVARVAASGMDAAAIHDATALPAVMDAVRDGDAILLLSSGPLAGLPETLPRALEEAFPA